MVDAIQGLGVLEFNAEEFHVDAVTAGMTNGFSDLVVWVYFIARKNCWIN